MRKQDLARTVAQRTKQSESQATAAVNAVFDVIQEALATGDEVRISGFGAFRVIDRSPRQGRHPRSGAPMRIGARRSAAFRAGSQLKRSIGGSDDD